MYLFIFEDGSIWKSQKCEEDDLAAADDGMLDIINIDDPEFPVRYNGGEWEPVGPEL